MDFPLSPLLDEPMNRFLITAAAILFAAPPLCEAQSRGDKKWELWQAVRSGTAYHRYLGTPDSGECLECPLGCPVGQTNTGSYTLEETTEQEFAFGAEYFISADVGINETETEAVTKTWSTSWQGGCFGPFCCLGPDDCTEAVGCILRKHIEQLPVGCNWAGMFRHLGCSEQAKEDGACVRPGVYAFGFENTHSTSFARKHTFGTSSFPDRSAGTGRTSGSIPTATASLGITSARMA